MHLRKIICSALVASSILTFTYTNYGTSVSLPMEIHEITSIENLSSGVYREHIQRFTSEGWLNINVVRMDLTDEYTEIKGIFNKEGLSNRTSISRMVEQHGALAGINGDYFNYSPINSTLGGLVNQGEMIISPVEISYALPSFFLDMENIGGVGYLDRTINLLNTSQNTNLIINTLNRLDDKLESTYILNKHWGSKSIGNKHFDDLVEVLVVNNIVTEIRQGQEAFTIPDNGYVILSRGPRKEDLLNYSKGDILFLSSDTKPSASQLKFAIGAGSIIVKNGELSLTDIHSNGIQPRSGIGINRDNTEIILVTVDGRNESFKGVSQAMFGAIMRDLGAYNAVNLDGGGSTTMATRKSYEEKAKVVNIPSGGSQRQVVNGIGIFSNAPLGQLSQISLSLSNQNVFNNSRVGIEIKGYDKNFNPVPIDHSRVSFSVEGVEGSFNNSIFYPSSPGKASIQVSIGDIRETIDVRVLSSSKEIITDISQIKLNPSEKYSLPSFSGIDSRGNRARLFHSDLRFEVLGDIGYIENSTFYSSNKNASGAILVYHGDSLKTIPLQVGNGDSSPDLPKSTSLRDEKNYAMDLNQGAKSFIVEGLSRNNSYSNYNNQDSFFINLNVNKGGIRANSAQQWLDLKHHLKTRSEKNIIINLTNPVFGSQGFKDPLEAKLFQDLLVEASKGDKEIFVFQGSSRNNIELREGIRYIELSNQGQIEIFLQGDQLSYVFLKEAGDILAELGVLKGDEKGNLMLDKNFTREQMVVMVSRLYGKESIAKNHPNSNIFKDVDRNFYSPYIYWSYDQGLVRGMEVDEFGYGSHVTVQQFQAILLRALNYNEESENWHEVPNQAKQLGLMKGLNLQASQALTRGNMAKMVINSLEINLKNQNIKLGQHLGLN